MDNNGMHKMQRKSPLKNICNTLKLAPIEGLVANDNGIRNRRWIM